MEKLGGHQKTEWPLGCFSLWCPPPFSRLTSTAKLDEALQLKCCPGYLSVLEWERKTREAGEPIVLRYHLTGRNLKLRISPFLFIGALPLWAS